MTPCATKRKEAFADENQNYRPAAGARDGRLLPDRLHSTRVRSYSEESSDASTDKYAAALDAYKSNKRS